MDEDEDEEEDYLVTDEVGDDNEASRSEDTIGMRPTLILSESQIPHTQTSITVVLSQVLNSQALAAMASLSQPRQSLSVEAIASRPRPPRRPSPSSPSLQGIYFQMESNSMDVVARTFKSSPKLQQKS
ncbi:hypothetical protein PIB30_079444 [Stylosanthes scabra]|uniref:Uncharacterized protein n=1 Tax=Stylosanthes scabra TaxID=79078 RepID=A0ABU6YTU8_9FABA|nr:hypothetical protein [Stylosanthes scabra]